MAEKTDFIATAGPCPPGLYTCRAAGAEFQTRVPSSRKQRGEPTKDAWEPHRRYGLPLQCSCGCKRSWTECKMLYLIIHLAD